MIRCSLRRAVVCRAGNAATEFAFLMPIMLLFAAGIVELGRAFQVYNAVNRLATRYATTYADCYDYPAGACNTELSTFTASNAIANMAPQLKGTVSLRMFEVTMSSATPPAATIKYASPAAATLTAAELAQAQTAIGASQTGVVVSVSYLHSLLFFSSLATPFFGSSKTVAYTVAQRKT